MGFKIKLNNPNCNDCGTMLAKQSQVGNTVCYSCKKCKKCVYMKFTNAELKFRNLKRFNVGL